MALSIAVLGAGAIGCHVGGSWASVLADRGQVTLIGRPSRIEPIRSDGLGIDGEAVPREAFSATTDTSALTQADLIAVAVKSTGLDPAMDDIAKHAKPNAVIVSLLNGLGPVRALRARFPDHSVLAGMVPYNVVWTGPTALERSGSGSVATERHATTETLASAGAELELHDDLSPIQHGKLLLNLANAVNALSGLPLKAMLLDRDYRRVYAASLTETLKVYDAAHIAWQQVGPTSPRLARMALLSPTWLFDRLVIRKQGLSDTSMTSMAQDLAAGRPTEIDTINGEVVRLGKRAGVPTPVNDALVAAVRAVESGEHAGGLSAAELLSLIDSTV
ncbi:MAG: 2-dehydropantoate 2-reductase [Pseudomonadota bacterium]